MSNSVAVTGKWGYIASGLAKRLLQQTYNAETSVSRSIYYPTRDHFEPTLLNVMQPTTLKTGCATVLNWIDEVTTASRNVTYGLWNARNLVDAYLFANKVPSQSGGTKIRKQQRGRMKGIASQGNHISFGTYALQALEPAWITAQQIESGRRAIVRNAGRDGKIWVRVFPDKAVTSRPAETRMGRGKGAFECWVAVVKPGRIIYEMSGVTEAVAKRAILVAASKMPTRTQFLTSG